jgi:hypothetical protein
MRRNPLVTSLVLLMLALGACGKTQDNTGLVVTVWTDYSVPDQLDEVRIEVSGATDPYPFRLASKADIPVQLGLMPGGAAAQQITVAAVGYLNGIEKVRQSARLNFDPGVAHVLDLHLATTCENRPCADSNYTCERGQCSLKIDVNVKDLPLYDPEATTVRSDASAADRADASEREAGREDGPGDGAREAGEVGQPDGPPAPPDAGDADVGIDAPEGTGGVGGVVGTGGMGGAGTDTGLAGQTGGNTIGGATSSGGVSPPSSAGTGGVIVATAGTTGMGGIAGTQASGGNSRTGGATSATTALGGAVGGTSVGGTTPAGGAAGGSAISGGAAGGTTATGGAAGGTTATGGAAGGTTTTGGAAGGTTATGGAAGGTTVSGGAAGGTTVTGGAAGGTTATGGTTSSGGATAPSTGPCDIYSSAATPCVAAYSMVRVLSKSYVGPLFQVRAGSSSTNNTMSGGTTQDIMPSPDGYVDSATVDAACGGTYCTVSVMYDHSGNGNHLMRAPKGNTAGGSTAAQDDYESIATNNPVKAGGHTVYSLYMNKYEGYRTQAGVLGNNMPLGTAPQGTYELADGTRKGTACCWDFGNVTPRPASEWAFADTICLGHTWWGNSGDTRWYGFGIDFEGGVWAGGAVEGDPGYGSFNSVGPVNTNNPSMDNVKFALGMIRVKSDAYAIRVADVSTATDLTDAWDGGIPVTVGHKGGIVLGVGTDNSNNSFGTFYEGAIVAGFPTNETELAVMKNIQSVGYSIP